MLAFRQLSPVFVPPPRLTGVSGPSIPAYVSAGAWVADCPFCNSALGYTQREQFYFCSNCLNKDAGGQLLEIVWPKNQATIERALQVRPEPDFMHWKPGVSVRELLRQNAAGFHHSWTAPRTWVANEIVTAALLNTHVRDNLLETLVAKFTTAGDIGYATAANAAVRLAAVAYRMPRANAGATALEYVAGLNLAQAPVYNSATSVNLTDSVFVDVVTQAFTTKGGIVVVFGLCQTDEIKSGAASANHHVKLQRDSTDIGLVVINSTYVSTASNAYKPTTVFAMETPAAAAYTFRVKALYTAGNTTGTPVAHAAILIMEFAP